MDPEKFELMMSQVKSMGLSGEQMQVYIDKFLDREDKKEKAERDLAAKKEKEERDLAAKKEKEERDLAAAKERNKES